MTNPTQKPEKSQISGIIEQYAARLRAIRRCAKEYIQLAKNASEQWKKGFVVRVQSHLVQESPDGKSITINIDHLLREEIDYHVSSPHSDILSQSLLILGFSAFDAFLGLLLARLYKEEPNLIHKIEEKEIKVAELIQSKSKEELISDIIDRDISSLLRKSYDDQFSALANRHSLTTLKKFPNWPLFIEASQRRNLITHCNGIINLQYLKACESAGYQLSEEMVVGHQLTADEEYVKNALEVLYEVGFKLANVLWRKAIPDSIEASEKIITDELFALLKREEWHLAKVIGEFAVNLPSKKSDLNNKISRINYAQALKWSGDDAGAMRILNAEDWSGSFRDLRLGVEVLRGRFDEAATLMREIGKTGELVRENGYRDWPVFREFRESPQFMAAFSEIYGKEFAASETEVTLAVVEQQAIGTSRSTPLPHTIEPSELPNGETCMPSYPPPSDDEAVNDSQSDTTT